MFDNSHLSPPVTIRKLRAESPQQPPYLVINGIELGEDDAIDEPWCLGHGVISQGLVELDLREEKKIREMHWWCCHRPILW